MHRKHPNVAQEVDLIHSDIILMDVLHHSLVPNQNN